MKKNLTDLARSFFLKYISLVYLFSQNNHFNLLSGLSSHSESFVSECMLITFVLFHVCFACLISKYKLKIKPTINTIWIVRHQKLRLILGEIKNDALIESVIANNIANINHKQIKLIFTSSLLKSKYFIMMFFILKLIFHISITIRGMKTINAVLMNVAPRSQNDCPHSQSIFWIFTIGKNINRAVSAIR